MTVSEQAMLNSAGRDAPTILWVPNLALLGLVGLVLVLSTCGERRRVERHALTDDATRARIEALERRLRYGASGSQAMGLELGRLYRKVGVYTWSYDALRTAEARGPSDPGWRLKLGLAYIELGRNDDGLRVVRQTLEACEPAACPAQVRARLVLYLRVAELMKERNIDARRDVERANLLFREVLKPAESTGLMPPAPASQPASGE